MSLNLELLKEISETPGAPGYETPIRRVALREVEPLVDETHIDNIGNLYAIKKGRSDKKVMVTAHMDEISFIITHIDDEGFGRIHTLGGFDPKTLTAQRVIAHGRDGQLTGVMGSKPIHIMKPEDRKKAPEIGDYFIDFGLPAEQVRRVISTGDIVTRQRELIELGDCVNGKSLDNRISVYVLVEALRRLKNPSHTVYGVFSVQEEVGLRGATVAAHRIDPYWGINIDTTIAFDTPGAKEHEKITRLGKGVAIKIMDGSVITDARMVNFMRHTADKHNIDWQSEILTAGGTDTAPLQRAGKCGSIAGSISIPTRHIHSVIESCHKHDIETGIQLLVACLENMDSWDWEWK